MQMGHVSESLFGTSDFAEAVEPQWLLRLREREEKLWKSVRACGTGRRNHLSPRATYVCSDALTFVQTLPQNSIHAVVTDPPYGMVEYQEKNHSKLRKGRGGVWRIPPSFDGANRKPVPRFTVLSKEEVLDLEGFFGKVASGLRGALVPGGHVFVASNPLLSTTTFRAFLDAGFEKRGEIIRLVQTLRGGDRPKGAEQEFSEVTAMPRSCWEPWGVFRKPIEGTLAENLRVWGTGGLRRISEHEPFKDVISCSPTRGAEKAIAPHPSLKPQRFMRKLVRAALPLGIGIVYDPFAGSGSTLAAAEALRYHAVGTDSYAGYLEMAGQAFEALASFAVNGS